MKIISKFALVLVWLGVGIGASHAQNTALVIQQDINFKLTGYYQMSPTENSTTLFRNAGKVSLTNKDIISMLGKQVNIVFSINARLLLISQTPVDLTPKVVIRDRYQGETFDTDVTQYFSARIFTSIEDTKINKNPLRTSGKSYDVIEFEMKLDQAEFRILGFGTLQVKTGKYQGDPVAIVHTGKVNSSGNGEYQLNILTGVVPVALTGTVQIGDAVVKAIAE